jgi:hypothetical protein
MPRFPVSGFRVQDKIVTDVGQAADLVFQRASKRFWLRRTVRICMEEVSGYGFVLKQSGAFEARTDDFPAAGFHDAGHAADTCQTSAP